MSANEPDERQVGVLEKAYRTVSPAYESRDDAEMNSIGWVMFLVMVALFVPLLPFILVVWGVSKLVDAVVNRE